MKKFGNLLPTNIPFTSPLRPHLIRRVLSKSPCTIHSRQGMFDARALDITPCASSQPDQINRSLPRQSLSHKLPLFLNAIRTGLNRRRPSIPLLNRADFRTRTFIQRRRLRIREFKPQTFSSTQRRLYSPRFVRTRKAQSPGAHLGLHGPAVQRRSRSGHLCRDDVQSAHAARSRP